MKKLPYISIEGVGNMPEEKLDSLIKLEPILAWLGYEDRSEHNNRECSDEYYIKKGGAYIYCCDENVNFSYYAMRWGNVYFLASDVTGIIHYVQNYKG